ncbi:phage EaA protein [Klebsiella pneumoniae]|nr:phage EaA protein [Klebsiella pneumoniae]
MTTDITELALMKGQKVEAPYYLAECTECGKMYSSSKLIESRNYFDGDADCYCPHCNAEDADIADLGSGEQPAAMAWNYQQARIDTLVEALERKEEQRANWFQMAQKLGEDLDSAEKRIAQLESRTVTVKLTDINEYLAEVHDKTLNRAFRLLAEGVRAGDVAAMRAAGIKVEAE